MAHQYGALVLSDKSKDILGCTLFYFMIVTVSVMIISYPLYELFILCRINSTPEKRQMKRKLKSTTSKISTRRVRI